MEKVLALIEEKKQKFSNLPLFQFMRDTSIDPRQRLAFVPCMSPFIMSFAELNNRVFREEPTTDKIQEIINKHTHEDGNHWVWFLRDFRQLGLDRSINFTDALRFLWGEETKAGRKLAQTAYRYTFQASPIQKLVVIEVIEATGNVFFTLASKIVTEELQPITQKKYLYFGEFHVAVEPGHTTDSQKEQQFIENIQLTEEEQRKYCDLVEKVFDLFAELTHELLAYGKKHDISEILAKSEPKEPLKVA